MPYPSTAQTLLNASGTLRVQDQLDAIQQRITELQQEIDILKQTYNTLTPINQLPPEILSTVFTLVRAEYRIHPGWIVLSHVCRKWRATALACPHLWSRPSLRNLDCARVMLSRSGESPLSLDYHFNEVPKRSEETKEAFYDMMSMVGHIESVNIDLVGGYKLDLRRAFEGWKGAAPLLRELKVAVPNPSSPENVIPSTALHGGPGAPLMESINLAGCSFTDWGLLPLGPNMTLLRLSAEDSSSFTTSNPPPTLPSAKQLVQSLRHMPLLQELHLSRYLPTRDGYTQIPHSEVPCVLSHLHKIMLDGSCDSVSDLLRVVHAPNLETASLRLRYILVHGGRGEEIRDLVTALKASKKDIMEAVFTDLSVFHEEEYGPNVHLFEFRRTGCAEERNKFLFRLSFNYLGHPLAKDLSTLRHTLNFSQLQSVKLDLAPSYSVAANMLIEIFGDLPYLRKITVTEYTLKSFISLLMVPSPKERPPVAKYPRARRFPALEGITIETSVALNEGTILSDLVSAMQMQRQVSPLQKLVLRNCSGIRKEELDRIECELEGLQVVWEWQLPESLSEDGIYDSR